MFQSELCLRADPVPDLWCVDQPLIWSDPVYGTLTVPVGFRTDLASIPRPLRWAPFLDPNGRSRRAAAMHDWLYAWRTKKKSFADLFLHDALLAEGASAATANTFYYAVHWFGGIAWKNDAGALESRDFDTAQHYTLWRATPDGRLILSKPA